MPKTPFTRRFCSLPVSADGSNNEESDCVASRQIMPHSICNIAISAYDFTPVMPLRSGISSNFCAVTAWFPPRRYQLPD
jgi:hypothetical protein